MRALLLAGGLGTRLRPITDSMPKCLVPIHRKPLLEYWLESLFADPRIERILVNTHHKAEQVNTFLAGSRWRDRVDLVHEERLLGTGGTVLANRAYFGGRPLFVAHADNLTNAPMCRLLDAYYAGGPDLLAALLAFRTATPSTCGILEIDAASRVVGFHEKVQNPPGDLANGAVYVFSPEVVERIAALGKDVVDLSTEIIPGLLPRVLAVEYPGFFMDIGSPEALESARKTFVSKS